MSLQVKRLVNRPVNSNCYVIYDIAVNSECVIIDPGTEDCMELEGFLSESELIPVVIVLTHEHFDHCWGCNYIQNKYRIPILCSEICREKVRHHKTNCSIFYNPSGAFDIAGAIVTIDNNLLFNGHSIYVNSVPGHTESSIVINVGKHIFTGDALINGQRTVSKLPGGSKQKVIDSCVFFESFLGKEMIVHPGHLSEFYLDDCDLAETLR